MIFLGIFGFFYIYLALDFIGPLGLTGFAEGFALLGLLLPFACILWLFRIFWNRRENPGEETVPDKILVWTAFLSMGVISFIFVTSIIRDAISLILLIVIHSPPPLHGPVSFWVISLISVICAGLGFKNARYVLSVSRVTVTIEGMPEELNGFRIGQISDLHIGSTIHRDQINRVVETINALNCDLIVLTGDIVDGYASELVDQIALLSKLKAASGTFYSTGNHEYYWGAPAIIAEIKKAGVQVLLNESVVVEKNGKQLLIAGVPDYTSAQMQGPKPDAALARSNVIARPTSGGAVAPNAVRVLLAHQPSMAEEGAAAGFDLQFSGHTHGGQFFPWTYAVNFVHKYPRGLYQVGGKMWLYVNRGTGYWGPPLRLGSPAEITLMTLRKKLAQPDLE